jgi:CheY-like chemotaxis protein
MPVRDEGARDRNPRVDLTRAANADRQSTRTRRVPWFQTCGDCEEAVINCQVRRPPHVLLQSYCSPTNQGRQMLDRPRVAVIDDNEIARASIEIGLSSQGWLVSPFCSNTGVVALVEHVRPKIVLLDDTPFVTGRDTLAEVLRERLGSCVKILLHTSPSSSDLPARVQESGADGFVEKTSDCSHLSRTLNAILRAG